MTLTILLIRILITLTVSASAAPRNQSDNYLLYCGELTNVVDPRWSTDLNSTFSPNVKSSSIGVPATSDQLRKPFTAAARIFKSNFTYTFPVSPGPKFLRLFFYPTVYSNSEDSYNASDYFLNAHANGHLLLNDFSPALTLNYPDLLVVKEYFLTVPNGVGSLNLTICPTFSRPASNRAFLNGIQLVSVPDHLYTTDDPSAALETAYRINIGGAYQTDGNVSDLDREWKADDIYLLSNYGQPGFSTQPIVYTDTVRNYTAPAEVYQTFRQLGGDGPRGLTKINAINSDTYTGKHASIKYNLTWGFEVDPGFNYSVRFHWCEVDANVNSTGERVFDVYINYLMARSVVDVMNMTHNHTHVPVYRDTPVDLTGQDTGGSRYLLLIQLYSNRSSYNEVLLNGLEIFKISKADGSLNGPIPPLHNQIPPLRNQIPSKQHPFAKPVIAAASIGGILLVASLVACILMIYPRVTAVKMLTKSITRTNNTTKSIPLFELGPNTPEIVGSTTSSHVLLRFSLPQIKLATNNFSEALLIGHGGFGNVYRAILGRAKGRLIEVAIKRLNTSSKQGAQEFMTEIRMLSKIRHVHLVSLIGYCDECGEMILMYDYMEHGTLREHLYDSNNPPLPWNQRLSICLGAAKGIHYLHAGVGQMIIHRDVKSTNILLDENWVPKVSDFGLSKLGPIGGDLHVSTAVKGSFGYMDPEYYMLQQLTEKSDVYSFGVVLFEVLCGRAAVDPNLPSEQANLAMWARSYQQRGEVDTIVDPIIKEEIAPACLFKFGEIAERCVREKRTERPSMVDVVWSLELALELQQHNMKFVYNDEFPLSMSQFTSLDTSQPSQSSTMVSTSQCSHGE